MKISHLMERIRPASLVAWFAVWLGLVLCPALAIAQFDFDEEPIRYGSAPVSDPVSKLNEGLDRGLVHLERNEERGYLDSVLKLLAIQPSSQVLVFSKTSFQREVISPRNPRALYFSDDVYIGWVRGGSVVEAASVDPKQGPIFFTLSQEPSERPRFVRHDAECLQCHASSLTKGVPGLVVRSVYPASDGLPILKAGTFTTDHSSPLRERWGGWYVTGTHGSEVHMGNTFLRDEDHPELLDTAPGSNVLDLGSRFERSGYLTPHSDIVSLMLLEHQSQMHNLIVRASYQARIALRDQDAMTTALGEPSGKLTDSTVRRLEYAAMPLLKYLLFVDEAKLQGPIQGTSSFAKDFAARGPRDGRGRSLRDLDLTRRLLRYPCSYLIYSDSTRNLPGPLKEHFYRRLFEVLSGADTTKDFANVNAEDRQAILEILIDTDGDLPDFWRKGTSRRL